MRDCRELYLHYEPYHGHSSEIHNWLNVNNHQNGQDVLLEECDFLTFPSNGIQAQDARCCLHSIICFSDSNRSPHPAAPVGGHLEQDGVKAAPCGHEPFAWSGSACACGNLHALVNLPLKVLHSLPNVRDERPCVSVYIQCPLQLIAERFISFLFGSYCLVPAWGHAAKSLNRYVSDNWLQQFHIFQQASDSCSYCNKQAFPSLNDMSGPHVQISYHQSPQIHLGFVLILKQGDYPLGRLLGMEDVWILDVWILE